mmetsp:Transcript_13280/g.31081  ORF Transcript_13280/g.31081 Transcript_13280/m.31081 type:complete len:232 (+) Transcript_13280:306-1001(+)
MDLDRALLPGLCRKPTRPPACHSYGWPLHVCLLVLLQHCPEGLDAGVCHIGAGLLHSQCVECSDHKSPLDRDHQHAERQTQGASDLGGALDRHLARARPRGSLRRCIPEPRHDSLPCAAGKHLRRFVDRAVTHDWRDDGGAESGAPVPGGAAGSLRNLRGHSCDISHPSGQNALASRLTLASRHRWPSHICNLAHRDVPRLSGQADACRSAVLSHVHLQGAVLQLGGKWVK